LTKVEKYVIILYDGFFGRVKAAAAGVLAWRKGAAEMIRFDVSKQIDFVGLQRTGIDCYRCRYPVVLAAWLREQGYKEKPIQRGEIARLVNSHAEVRVRKTGSVRVVGEEATDVHNTLEPLIKY
jgi:hypothetical protein